MEVCSHNNNDPNTILLKINGTLCNLSCSYCSEIKKSYKSVIDQEELSRLFKELPNDTEIILHGGEPLLDLDYTKEVISLFRIIRPLKKLSIQTNGCISEDMRQLIFDNKDILKIGVSIDGPGPLNVLRSDAQNKSTFERTDDTIRFFKENDIDIKCIVTVNAINVNYPIDVLNYFLGYPNIKQIRFNPCFDMSGDELAMYAIRPSEFLNFLFEIQKVWIKDKLYRTIRIDPLQAVLEDELSNQMSANENNNRKSVSNSIPSNYNEKNQGERINCCQFISVYPNRKYTICDALGVEIFDAIELSGVFSQADKVFGQSLKRPCEECVLFKGCGGGCIAIFRRFKNSRDLISDYCSYRRTLRMMIRNLVNIG